ncbi:MAG TPA: group II intron reverse transcriptase/maturase [Thermoanaerobaculaceae bacterium]|nr:group II intron reverse transcriptase/maturase [Thermoanaerobaculaceae bacterium]
MNAKRKSDESVVPAKPANNGAAGAPAESVEGRDSAKRNAEQAALSRTQSRTQGRSCGLHGVREAARKDRALKFTALLHHVTTDCLTEAFYHLKKTAAVGVDGVTWHEYERNLEANIAGLHDRIHRGAYRAKPSRRAWIPKPDGRQRPLGIAALEDKIVQQAVLWVVQSIYEQDFLGFSYGFRPGRSQHDALDALSVAITGKRVNWILDADIAGFFDTIDHAWLMRFLEHRIGDRRLLRLIRKWLRAGVSEDGQWSKTTVGTPQGAVISPLLANVYLHYVLDLWIVWWRRNRCRGEMIVVRYADDFVMGFESHSEAKACLEELRARFAKFGLKLHEGKTRLIEFGRFAAERRAGRGEGRPETFDFLGFTHQCTQTREQGWFALHRHTIAKRMRATLQAIKAKLRKRMHRPLGETGRWLRSVVQGWLNYHAVPSNSNRLQRFVDEVTRLWLQVLRRRHQRGRARWTWERMQRLARRHLPRPRILHPYPNQRFRARLKARAV